MSALPFLHRGCKFLNCLGIKVNLICFAYVFLSQEMIGQWIARRFQQNVMDFGRNTELVQGSESAILKELVEGTVQLTPSCLCY